MSKMKTEVERGNSVQSDPVQRKVVLRGLAPIMFDKYAGDNKTQLEWHQKAYYGEDGKTLGLPSTNIVSFLASENTMSATKRLFGKGFRSIAQGCLSYVSIEPFFIPITRDGKPLVVKSFTEERESETGLWRHRSVARLKGGVPNPKDRPVLSLPWEVSFTLTLYPNNEVKEPTLVKIFKDGGRALGLGTYRGVFGKFEVFLWE